jgi:hypothetical protein
MTSTALSNLIANRQAELFRLDIEREYVAETIERLIRERERVVTEEMFACLVPVNMEFVDA